MAREVHGVLARAGADFENSTGPRQFVEEHAEYRLLVTFTGFRECEHLRILGQAGPPSQISWARRR
jgi:hypothetical protein